MENLSQGQIITDLAYRPRKMRLYFVELDDEDRERVISCVVEGVSFTAEARRDHVYSTSTKPLLRSMSTMMDYTLEAKIVPDEEGVSFRMENFSDNDHPDATYVGEEPDELDY